MYLIENNFNVFASSRKHFKMDQIYKLDHYLKLSSSDIKRARLKTDPFQPSSPIRYCADLKMRPGK
jgi:glucose-6-phosphate 1-dehydrogenase